MPQIKPDTLYGHHDHKNVTQMMMLPNDIDLMNIDVDTKNSYMVGAKLTTRKAHS